MHELSRHAYINKINLNEAFSAEMLSCVRSVRGFKRRARKRKNKDIRNMLDVIVNSKVNCVKIAYGNSA